MVFILVFGIALVTPKSRTLHDYIGGTVVADMDSQYLIDTLAEKIAAQREEYKDYMATQKKANK
jgi:hypothetical protein